MKIFLGLIALLLMAVTPAHALTIFACEPEWASLAKEIGGDKVEVKTASTAKQDVHHIQAKPSLIAAIRQADMLFCTGAELEIGWLPVLQAQAGSEQVQVGGEGYFMASDHVKKLEVPTRLDRAEGDVHAAGNPHIQLDPRNIALVADAFAQKLVKLDSANAAYYHSRLADFQKRWKVAMVRWEAEASNLKGMPVTVQHTTLSYLANWLGLEVVAPLEPKPGVPPTSGYLAEVLGKAKAQNVKAILYAVYEDDAPSKWLAERTNIPLVQLPFTVGGSEKVTDLFSLFDETIMQLKNANH